MDTHVTRGLKLTISWNGNAIHTELLQRDFLEEKKMKSPGLVKGALCLILQLYTITAIRAPHDTYFKSLNPEFKGIFPVSIKYNRKTQTK